jgi:hypothetical protein
MPSVPTAPAYDRVSERPGAVALAPHLREADGLSIAQIAEIADQQQGRLP